MERSKQDHVTKLLFSKAISRAIFAIQYDTASPEIGCENDTEILQYCMAQRYHTVELQALYNLSNIKAKQEYTRGHVVSTNLSNQLSWKDYGKNGYRQAYLLVGI